MALREQFTQSMKDAMKGGEKERLGVIRMMMSALKDRDIEARGQGKEPLSDEDILGLLQKLVKQRQDSIALYNQGGRPELAAQEEAEIGVIRSFMPQQMSEAETRAAISAVIASVGAAGVKDMGKVMGALKGQYSGKMDFGMASPLVKELLS